MVPGVDFHICPTIIYILMHEILKYFKFCIESVSLRKWACKQKQRCQTRHIDDEQALRTDGEQATPEAGKPLSKNRQIVSAPSPIHHEILKRQPHHHHGVLDTQRQFPYTSCHKKGVCISLVTIRIS